MPNMTLFPAEDAAGSLFRGFRRIFWGILLLLFQFNINAFPLLPDFLGYAAILSGLKQIRARASSPGLSRATVIGWVLFFLAFLDFLALFSGTPFSPILPYAILWTGLNSGLQLLFWFEILNAAAEILQLDGMSEYARHVNGSLHGYMLLYLIQTVGLLGVTVWQGNALGLLLIVIAIIARLWLLRIVAGVKRQYEVPLSVEAEELPSEGNGGGKKNETVP